MSSIPAWKRLGLKLKAAPDGQTNGAPSQTTATPSSLAIGTDRQSPSTKRKPSGAPALDHSAKKPRWETPSTPGSQTKPKTPKSVSFAAEPDFSPAPATSGTKVPKKPKQKHSQDKAANEASKAAKPKSGVKPLVKKENAVANLQSAIDYLRQWHSSRDSWKFNKNHQTRLLEYVFTDETTIPAVDINIFYEYIRPLKGYVRKRLRETAEEVKQKDMEQGAEGFSTSKKDAAERKQKEYEEVIAGFLNEGRTPEKRRFEEVEYVLRTADMEMQRRVVKRMRAEMVLDELSGSEDSETTTSSATVTETEPESPGGEASRDGAVPVSEGDKRLKLNDGTQKRVRKRKARTAEVDDSSSSSEAESDSDSDMSSSDSDSSDDSGSDDAMQVDAARNEGETSSSSSSSSSEAESGSEDESSDDED